MIGCTGGRTRGAGTARPRRAVAPRHGPSRPAPRGGTDNDATLADGGGGGSAGRSFRDVREDERAQRARRRTAPRGATPAASAGGRPTLATRGAGGESSPGRTRSAAGASRASTPQTTYPLHAAEDTTRYSAGGFGGRAGPKTTPSALSLSFSRQSVGSLPVFFRKKLASGSSSAIMSLNRRPPRIFRALQLDDVRYFILEGSELQGHCSGINSSTSSGEDGNPRGCKDRSMTCSSAWFRPCACATITAPPPLMIRGGLQHSGRRKDVLQARVEDHHIKVTRPRFSRDAGSRPTSPHSYFILGLFWLQYSMVLGESRQR